MRAQQRLFPKSPRHKSPKFKAVLQLIWNSILSTYAIGMPPPYFKSSHEPKVVLARYTDRKLTFQRTRNFTTMLIHSSNQSQ